MHLSTHYYVLSLSPRTNTLFEAFRDSLIMVENQGFPVVAPPPASDSTVDDQRRTLAHKVDQCFAHYATLDPLALVLVGEEGLVSAFMSVTAHGSAVIGRIEGDHEGTTAHDLGLIIWPVVKEAMSGVLDQAMRDLDAHARRGRVATGLEAVARAAKDGARTTLLVEDDFHMRGSVHYSGGVPVISSDVDVSAAIDDVVDAVIEMILQSGGNVVFTPGGSLSGRSRIVLLMHGTEAAREPVGDPVL